MSKNTRKYNKTSDNKDKLIQDKTSEFFDWLCNKFKQVQEIEEKKTDIMNEFFNSYKEEIMLDNEIILDQIIHNNKIYYTSEANSSLFDENYNFIGVCIKEDNKYIIRLFEDDIKSVITKLE
jgi:hypothetical protein